jgi:hypothetical protein
MIMKTSTYQHLKLFVSKIMNRYVFVFILNIFAIQAYTAEWVSFNGEAFSDSIKQSIVDVIFLDASGKKTTNKHAWLVNNCSMKLTR